MNQVVPMGAQGVPNLAHVPTLAIDQHDMALVGRGITDVAPGGGHHPPPGDVEGGSDGHYQGQPVHDDYDGNNESED